MIRFVACALFALAVLASQRSSAQTSAACAVLCGNWKLVWLQSSSGIQHQSEGLEFRLNILNDGSIFQGLYPEGMSRSEWSFDPVTRVMETFEPLLRKTETVHVVAVTDQLLVLESTESNRVVLKYERLR